jgi:hypothetical protein
MPRFSLFDRFFKFFRRPSFWVGVVAVLAYCDPQALQGEFVYDDAGSVKRNIVVTGQVPFLELFRRDFWGTPMKDPQSHKSYRPLTTLTFWLNHQLSLRMGTLHTDRHTLGFHVINVLLHGIVAALLAEVLGLVLAPASSSNENGGGGGGKNASTGALRVLLHSGLLFAVHPVHAEAVSNITSRGELLMSAFYLLAVLSYLSGTAITKKKEDVDSDESISAVAVAAPEDEKVFAAGGRSAAAASGNVGGSNGAGKAPFRRPRMRLRARALWAVAPAVCLAASVFSKEQGATCLLAAVVADLVMRFGSASVLARRLLRALARAWRRRKSETAALQAPTEPPVQDGKLREENGGGEQDRHPYDDGDNEAIGFALRAATLGVQTVAVCLARLSINGPTRPDFIEDQNPAGFAPDRLTRILSVNYVYCLYLWDFVWPAGLCPDWSGRSIELIRSLSDPRAGQVAVLWAFVAWCSYQLLFLDLCPNDRMGSDKNGDEVEDDHREGDYRRRRFFSLTTRQKQHVLVAFWSFVSCPFLLSSNLLVVVGLMKADRVVYLPLAGLCLLQAVAADWVRERLPPRLRPALHLLVLLQLGSCCAKTHERNLAWSKSELLWQEAYRVNPVSYHTMYVPRLLLLLRARDVTVAVDERTAEGSMSRR